MGAQPSPPHPFLGKGSNIPAIIGMGLALLGLLCTVLAAMHGTNLFLALIVGLLVTRLFALCYGSLRTSSESTQLSSQNASHSGYSFASDAPDIPVGPNPFAASGFSMNAAPSFYPQDGQPLPYNTTFSATSQPVGYTMDASYIPIEQDELFQLDLPTIGEYILYLPKEGQTQVDCQDRYALNPRKGRYAITDGVSGSFVPTSWARIIARGFVEYELDARQTVPMMSQGQDATGSSQYFGERSQFEQWLNQCRMWWYEWMKNRWVPTINARRMQFGDSPLDWESEIVRGAQTTLTGCALRPRSNPADPYIDVYVSSIGDSEFFLFRRDEQGIWQNVAALPYISIDEFDNQPAVLTTAPEATQTDRAWTQRQEGYIAALPGDRIVLATATLAQWILMQVQMQGSIWTMLLDSTNQAAHQQMLRSEQHANRLGNDDVTMLVIPVTSPYINRPY